jgi:hypothetical protein
MPTSFNYDGKPGYIYNAADDTWYELSGLKKDQVH